MFVLDMVVKSGFRSVTLLTCWTLVIPSNLFCFSTMSTYLFSRLGRVICVYITQNRFKKIDLGLNRGLDAVHYIIAIE